MNPAHDPPRRFGRFSVSTSASSPRPRTSTTPSNGRHRWKNSNWIGLPEPGEKRQHQAEVLNIVDRGTSMPLLSLIRGDFTMATTIQTLAAFFATHGCPPRLRFDRDPRLMGAPTMRDFPSQFLRLLLCLGIDPIPCPPHRPDLKPYVERFNKGTGD